MEMEMPRCHQLAASFGGVGTVGWIWSCLLPKSVYMTIK